MRHLPHTLEELRSFELARSRDFDLARAGRLRAEADDIEHRTPETRAAYNAAFATEKAAQLVHVAAIRRREDVEKGEAAP